MRNHRRQLLPLGDCGQPSRIGLGRNFIDTAASQGEDRSEKIVSQILRERAASGRKENIFVATKTPPALVARAAQWLRESGQG